MIGKKRMALLPANETFTAYYYPNCWMFLLLIDVIARLGSNESTGCSLAGTGSKHSGDTLIDLRKTMDSFGRDRT